jgi:membrane-associated phospholipid phosphatase
VTPLAPISAKAELHRTYTAVDRLVIAYLAATGILAAIYHDRVPGWWIFFAANTATIAGVLYLAGSLPTRRSRTLHRLRFWYPALLLMPLFEELSFLIHPIHPKDFDRELALLDRSLCFGADPVAVLQRFAQPWITDILQVAYSSFYFLPLGLLFFLYREERFQEFLESQFGMLLCFFLSYFGYMLVPALGPRFFPEGNVFAPEGLTVGPILQKLLNMLERAGQMRDAFPSGHTAIALMVQWYALRFYGRRGVWISPLIGALLISTVYLGYHYVVDVIAGGLLALFCLIITPWLARVAD